MNERLSPDEARAALASVELGRRRVLDEVDLPRWYWFGLAAGWIVLGVLGDVADPAVGLVATVGFGAAHAAVASRVIDGRRRSSRLQVRAGLVTRHVPLLVIGFVAALSVVTVALALALSADGAEHPATLASSAVAVVVLLGGPQLLAAVRRRAARRVTAA